MAKKYIEEYMKVEIFKLILILFHSILTSCFLTCLNLFYLQGSPNYLHIITILFYVIITLLIIRLTKKRFKSKNKLVLILTFCVITLILTKFFIEKQENEILEKTEFKTYFRTENILNWQILGYPKL
jgi:uncharacterized membrane protein